MDEVQRPAAVGIQLAIRDLLEMLDQFRRILLVNPADYPRIRQAVADLPIELMPGLIEVRAEQWVDPGKVIVAAPNPAWPLPNPHLWETS